MRERLREKTRELAEWMAGDDLLTGSVDGRDRDLLAIGMALRDIEHEEWIETDEERRQLVCEVMEFLSRLRDNGFAVVQMVGGAL